MAVVGYVLEWNATLFVARDLFSLHLCLWLPSTNYWVNCSVLENGSIAGLPPAELSTGRRIVLTWLQSSYGVSPSLLLACCGSSFPSVAVRWVLTFAGLAEPFLLGIRSLGELRLLDWAHLSVLCHSP